jgi:hypothetical protein
MQFTRLYPVELLFRGTVGSKDSQLDSKGREEKLREWFAVDKPGIIIDKVTEEKGLTGTPENDYVYRISGFSTDPTIR